MPRFNVSATGREPITVEAVNWLGAFGVGLEALGIDPAIGRLACELLPNGTVIARDAKGGTGFVVQEAGDASGPEAPPDDDDEPSHEADHGPFALANLPQAVMISSMGQALRAPLNTVLGFSDMLAEDATADGRSGLADDLRRVNAAGASLLELVDALVLAARVEAGEEPPVLDRFDVAPAVSEAAAAVLPTALRLRRQLIVDCASGFATLVADPKHLRFAMVEALERALAVTEREVAIRGRVEDGDERARLRLTIHDQGPILSPTELAAVFEVFGHADPAASPTVARAVRLAVARRQIEAMGGQMEIGQAASPHGGSVVTIRLPLAPTAPRPA